MVVLHHSAGKGRKQLLCAIDLGLFNRVQVQAVHRALCLGNEVDVVGSAIGSRSASSTDAELRAAGVCSHPCKSRCNSGSNRFPKQLFQENTHEFAPYRPLMEARALEILRRDPAGPQ